MCLEGLVITSLDVRRGKDRTTLPISPTRHWLRNQAKVSISLAPTATNFSVEWILKRNALCKRIAALALCQTNLPSVGLLNLPQMRMTIILLKLFRRVDTHLQRNALCKRIAALALCQTNLPSVGLLNLPQMRMTIVLLSQLVVTSIPGCFCAFHAHRRSGMKQTRSSVNRL